MKRSIKVLSLVLLLALCVSTLGIFSAFAEDATALTPTVVVDMDSKSSLTATNKLAVTRDEKTVNSPSATKKTDENGEDYWLIETNVAAGEMIGKLNDKGTAPAGAYFQFTPTSKIIVRSGCAKSGYETKNTDFMVIDLDVATGDNLIQSLLFHMRYSGSGSSTSTSQDGNGYPKINAYGHDGLYLSMSKKDGYEFFPLADAEDEWVDVTFVYDFRGEDYSSWKAHAYMNGYYVGTFASATDSTSYWFQYLRLSVPSYATEDYESTKIRNLTYTTYPVGWTGDLTGAAALGSFGSTLYDIDELAYCLEGTNAKKSAVIATITRGEETIDITDFDDLNANFEDNDVVELKANVNTPILVNAANVTFTETGYRYSLVDTSAVDFTTAKYVVVDRITGAYKSSGDAEAFASLELADGNIVILLDDLTRTATGTVVYVKNGTFNVTFDLNGHTMLIENNGRAFNVSGGSNGILRFKDGQLNYNGGNNIGMLSGDNALVFEQLDLTINDDTFIDQRNGLVLVKDCDVECPNCGTDEAPSYGVFLSHKGDSNIQSGFHFINSTFVNNGKYFCSVANYASSQRRYGGLNANVHLVNSDIKTPADSVFTMETYCNQKLDVDEAGNVTSSYNNKTDVDFNVVNSTVSTGYRFLDTNLKTLSYTLAKTKYNTTDSDGDGTLDATSWITLDTPYYANDMSIDVDIDLTNSEIACSSVVQQLKGATLTYDDVTYAYDVAVNADATSKIKASLGVMWQNVKEEQVTSSLTLADGVELGNALLTREKSLRPIDVVTLGAGESVVAYTGLGSEGYNCVVTSTYRAGSYTINNFKAISVTDSGEFFWNGDAETDPIVIDKVVKLPAATTEYYYTDWAVTDNNYVSEIKPAFSLNANLSALTDFYLNVYLSNNVNLDKITMTVDGKAVENFVAVTADGKGYYKAEDQVIKGITPEEVGDAYPVTVSFKGGFEEKVNLTTSVSIEQYLVRANKLDLGGNAGAFVQAIINYVVAATDYKGDAPASLAAIATTPGETAFGTAKWDALDGVKAGLNLGDSVRWVFDVDKTKTYTITYGDVARKCTADENGQIIIGMKAIYLLEDITISDGTKEATINLAGYRKALAGDELAQAVVDAMYHYSVAAAAYAN